MCNTLYKITYLCNKHNFLGNSGESQRKTINCSFYSGSLNISSWLIFDFVLYGIPSLYGWLMNEFIKDVVRLRYFFYGVRHFGEYFRCGCSENEGRNSNRFNGVYFISLNSKIGRKVMSSIAENLHR